MVISPNNPQHDLNFTYQFYFEQVFQVSPSSLLKNIEVLDMLLILQHQISYRLLFNILIIYYQERRLTNCKLWISKKLGSSFSVPKRYNYYTASSLVVLKQLCSSFSVPKQYSYYTAPLLVVSKQLCSSFSVLKKCNCYITSSSFVFKLCNQYATSHWILLLLILSKTCSL